MKVLSAVEQVDALLRTALQSAASDIHLQPYAGGLSVRLRTHGKLQQYCVVPHPLAQSVIARVKVLADLDVAQHRICQDGKLLYTYQEQVVDVRVATFPTVWGEHVVLRLLAQPERFNSFARLGMTLCHQEDMQTLLKLEQGLIIITGPTGSGKTTTAYTVISQLNDGSRNIMTLEDPVEYSISGISQSQLQPVHGLSFAQAIKSVVRHDPDVIMIGEIRDPESARAVLQAAMTGHLVITCMHTADACSAIIRLLDMGIEPYLLNAALTAIIAQRLVPATCNGELHTDECRCAGSGYSGQMGIFELVRLSPTMRQIIATSRQYDALVKQMHSEGYSSLCDDLAHKIKQGLIDPQVMSMVDL